MKSSNLFSVALTMLQPSSMNLLKSSMLCVMLLVFVMIYMYSAFKSTRFAPSADVGLFDRKVAGSILTRGAVL